MGLDKGYTWLRWEQRVLIVLQSEKFGGMKRECSMAHEHDSVSDDGLRGASSSKLEEGQCKPHELSH